MGHGVGEPELDADELELGAFVEPILVQPHVGAPTPLTAASGHVLTKNVMRRTVDTSTIAMKQLARSVRALRHTVCLTGCRLQKQKNVK